MKIAHVVCVFPPYKGGMGNSAYHFCRELVSLGEEVAVFTPSYDENEKEEVIDGIRVCRLRPFFSFGNAAVLPKLLDKLNDFEIVHLHYPFFGSTEMIILAKIIRKKRMKLVIHYHMDAVGSGWKGFIFALERLFVLPAIIRLADAITVGSTDYIENSEVCKYFIHHRQKFNETLFGVDISRFKPDFSKKTRNVLFVAGLDKAHYFKGLNVLLRSMKKIVSRPDGQDIILYVVGDGDLRKEYEAEAESLGISRSVRFLGSVSDNDLPGLYSSSGVFVLPSVNQGEAFGLVLLEAMSSGTAVVASDLPGVRKVFTNSEQGYLSTANDSDDLADKIMTVLDGNVYRFGLSARQLVEQKYTWQSVGEKLLEIYKKI